MIKRGNLRKRGTTENELLLILFDVLLAVVVLFSLMSFIVGVANQTIFQKNYLARDIVTTINALYASPGEIIYNYDENIGEFEFGVSSNEIFLGDPNRFGQFDTSYPFGLHPKFPAFAIKGERNGILLVKDLNQLYIETKNIKKISEFDREKFYEQQSRSN